jgi:hypothetical protein
MCGWPEGNSGGGGVRGRWSTARGEERWYTTARCLLRRRGAQRGTGGVIHGGSTVVEQGDAGGVTGGRKKSCSRGVGLPLYSVEAVDGGRRDSESGGGETAVGNRGCDKLAVAMV